jgi:hypothetical protein
MVAGAWYTMLAHHVDHFLMAFDEGEMMFEDLIDTLACAMDICMDGAYFGPWNMSGRLWACTSPPLRPTSETSTFVLGKRAIFWRICHD